MTERKNMMKPYLKDIFLAISGSVLLLTGISLVLLWWPELIIFFKGVIGMLLAVGGLVVLAMVKRD